MLGIKAIASFIPSQWIDNVAQGEAFGESRDFIAGKIGALYLPVKAPEEETSDLAVGAVRALFAKCPQLPEEGIDALVVVTQNGDGAGLPHTSAIVQKKLGLSNRVASFDVSLGCSGYVYGLHIIKGFMESAGLKNGLLVTADPYSKVVDRGDRVTSLLFGDAATATWIGDDPKWLVGRCRFGTDGGGAEHLQIQDGVLHMNGRQVFNFASLTVAPHIRQVIADAGLIPGQVDAYCIHQGSAAIVDAVARRFGDEAGKFVKDMKETGNTVSSSIPLLLEKYAFDSSWKVIAISGFGVGLSWASGILTRSDRND